MRYRAFISYSHADEKTARWLMRQLEAYRVPRNLVGAPGRDGPIPAKLGQMFRDRDELPSAGDLSSTISAALADSSALVVICSPSSARSRWVNAEIEAFRASGRGERIFSIIIDGDPASREPGVASFPQALIEPESPGGPEREPLAADARKAGDGRDRAFLKLVAGLLGVGFDDLAQREAQQRHRRMAYITMASLAGMAIALSLAVTAYIARNDAERRQAQAEDILGFMLGDLRKNLTKIGKLDLMRSVDDKATGYFATLNPRDLSDRTLEQQARSLTGIGEVRLQEGNYKEAMTAFSEAHTRTNALYDRQPKNGQRLFDLSQAQFWIGFVALEQGRFDDARQWLIKYRDSTIKLAAMDRSKFAWQQEAAYGYHNIGALDFRMGRYHESEQAMRAERELYAGWLKQRPNDFNLRYEAANVDSFLGSLMYEQGRLKEAEAYYSAQEEAMRLNRKEDPDNVKWKELHADSRRFQAKVQASLGKWQQAWASALEASQVSAELTALDPKNIGWSNWHGQSIFWLARLADRNGQDAQVHADKAQSILGIVHTLDSTNESVALSLAKSRNFQAQLALKKGDTRTVPKHAQAALDVLAPFWKSERKEDHRILLAEAYWLKGQAARADGNLTEADEHWQAALALLSQGGLKNPPFLRLEMLVRTLNSLGRSAEAKVHIERLGQSGFVPLLPYP
jgi:tetratricopeptide (TPR) repeat protein